jgi:hypothetical protein
MQIIDLGKRQLPEVLRKYFNRYAHESAELTGANDTILDRLTESIAIEPRTSKPAFELDALLKVTQRLTSEKQISYEEITSKMNLESSYRHTYPVDFEDLSDYVLENTFYCTDDQALIAFLSELYILALKGKLDSATGEFNLETKEICALRKLVALLDYEKQIQLLDRIVSLNLDTELETQLANELIPILSAEALVHISERFSLSATARAVAYKTIDLWPNSVQEYLIQNFVFNRDNLGLLLSKCGHNQTLVSSIAKKILSQNNSADIALSLNPKDQLENGLLVVLRFSNASKVRLSDLEDVDFTYQKAAIANYIEQSTSPTQQLKALIDLGLPNLHRSIQIFAIEHYIKQNPTIDDIKTNKNRDFLDLEEKVSKLDPAAADKLRKHLLNTYLPDPSIGAADKIELTASFLPTAALDPNFEVNLVASSMNTASGVSTQQTDTKVLNRLIRRFSTHEGTVQAIVASRGTELAAISSNMFQSHNPLDVSLQDQQRFATALLETTTGNESRGNTLIAIYQELDTKTLQKHFPELKARVEAYAYIASKQGNFSDTTFKRICSNALATVMSKRTKERSQSKNRTSIVLPNGLKHALGRPVSIGPKKISRSLTLR